MEEKIQITSLTGLISQAQLSEVVSALVSFYNGKINELKKDNEDLAARIKALEDENIFIVQPDTTEN